MRTSDVCELGLSAEIGTRARRTEDKHWHVEQCKQLGDAVDEVARCPVESVRSHHVQEPQDRSKDAAAQAEEDGQAHDTGVYENQPDEHLGRGHVPDAAVVVCASCQW